MRKHIYGGFAAVAAMLALTTTAASAQPAPHRITPQCSATTHCVTPDSYTDAGAEKVLAAPSLAVGSALVTSLPDSTDPSQDFRYYFLGTVGSLTNDGDGPFYDGLTSLDYSEFGADAPVFRLGITPGGFVTNKCAANIGNVLTVRTCRSGRWQTFIGTPYCAGVDLINPDGWYFVSAVVAASAAGHFVAQAGSPGQAVTFTWATGVNNQNWDVTDTTDPAS